MKRTYSQIDMNERRKIARWRIAGISMDHIAAKLGRHRSTIFREIKRYTFNTAQVPRLQDACRGLPPEASGRSFWRRRGVPDSLTSLASRASP